jgi:hypothetical protein
MRNHRIAAQEHFARIRNKVRAFGKEKMHAFCFLFLLYWNDEKKQHGVWKDEEL